MAISPQQWLPQFSTSDTFLDARTRLEQDGWKQTAEGDWAWVLAAPGVPLVARVTPWDPAYLLHVENCLRHTEHPYLPRIEYVSHLVNGGYVTFIERLQPANPKRATAFCFALGLGNDTEQPNWLTASADTSEFFNDRHLEQLHHILKESLDFGEAHLPFWGGSDIGPENVMADACGRLKIIDPLFIRGRAIAEAILNSRADLLRQLPMESLRAFLTIPRLAAAPDIEEMRRKLHNLISPHTPG